MLESDQIIGLRYSESIKTPLNNGDHIRQNLGASVKKLQRILGDTVSIEPNRYLLRPTLELRSSLLLLPAMLLVCASKAVSMDQMNWILL